MVFVPPQYQWVMQFCLLRFFFIFLGVDSVSILFHPRSFQKPQRSFPWHSGGFSRKIRIPGFRMDMEATPIFGFAGPGWPQERENTSPWPWQRQVEVIGTRLQTSPPPWVFLVSFLGCKKGIGPLWGSRHPTWVFNLSKWLLTIATSQPTPVSLVITTVLTYQVD